MSNNNTNIPVDSTLVNKIYDDVLHKPAEEIGKTLALIPKVINTALLPIQEWIYSKEVNFEKTKILISEKLENVPEEKIVSPESCVAVPAIQALSYSMDSDELRNMYANLLAKAMNKDTRDQVHPAFTEFIRQMSPIDADILKIFLDNPQMATPLIDVIERNQENNSYFLIIPNLTNISKYDNLTVSISIDNLLRLGLINIPADKSINSTSAYETITDTMIFKNFKEIYKLKPGYKIDILKKLISITELGTKFSEICIQDLESK